VDPVVLSVTQMRAGTEAYNVIPSTCHLAGTLRAFSPEVRRNVPGMVAKLVRTVAAAWDVDAHVEWNAKASNPLRSEVGYPPTVNTPKQGGFEGVVRLAPRAAADALP
jgi:metal-dependent amidase/aminoacylase/carboxypeptidase family protein